MEKTWKPGSFKKDTDQFDPRLYCVLLLCSYSFDID